MTRHHLPTSLFLLLFTTTSGVVVVVQGLLHSAKQITVGGRHDSRAAGQEQEEHQERGHLERRLAEELSSSSSQGRRPAKNAHSQETVSPRHSAGPRHAVFAHFSGQRRVEATTLPFHGTGTINEDTNQLQIHADVPFDASVLYNFATNYQKETSSTPHWTRTTSAAKAELAAPRLLVQSSALDNKNHEAAASASARREEGRSTKKSSEVEMLRFVTPYGAPMNTLVDVTHFAPLLLPTTTSAGEQMNNSESATGANERQDVVGENIKNTPITFYGDTGSFIWNTTANLNSRTVMYQNASTGVCRGLQNQTDPNGFRFSAELLFLKRRKRPEEEVEGGGEH
ncbi:unnamed protein product, partial [Amoebophrya sp. A120]|eukprot:GSA120T00000573001.1